MTVLTIRMTNRARESSDVEIRRRGQANPRAGVDLLYREYAPAVLLNLYMMLRDSEAAKDLTQEVFVKAYAQPGFFSDDRPFKPWLLKVASRLALNHVRDNSRRLKREARQERRTVADPLDVVLSRQVQEGLLTEISRLPVTYRQVFVLKYYEDLSCEEIADVLDLPLGTVMSHLFRARLVLRRRMS